MLEIEKIEIELTPQAILVLKRMAKNTGLQTPEQMATNIILMAVDDFKRLRRETPK